MSVIVKILASMQWPCSHIGLLVYNPFHSLDNIFDCHKVMCPIDIIYSTVSGLPRTNYSRVYIIVLLEK